jgi:hypothetical protein
MLAASRRYGLEQIAEELRLRILEHKKDPKEAIAGHERAIPVAQRLRAGPVELYHHLDIATLAFDALPGGLAKASKSVRRARELTETLHLLPPSLGLLREWLLEGRLAAAEERYDAARDRWSAIVDRPGPVLYPRLRAEAAVRLALLEFAEDRPTEAKEHLAPLRSEGLRGAIPRDWKLAPEDVEAAAAGSRHGAGPLPRTNPEAPRSGSSPRS